MDEYFKAALAEYGSKLKADGWEAAEPIIERHSRRWPDFHRFATALGIMLRADEILEEVE